MDIDTFALHYLLHSADLVEDALRKRLESIGLRPKQARVLDALAHMEPASQVRLAREFNVSPASMSTMTARLNDAGFITREPDPNEARTNVLHLTELGRSKLADIHAAWRDIDAMIVDKLGPERSTELNTLTRALRDSLGGRAPGQGKPRGAKPVQIRPVDHK